MARFVDAIAWIALNTEQRSDVEDKCVDMVASLWRKSGTIIEHDVNRYRNEMPRSIRWFVPSYNPTAP